MRKRVGKALRIIQSERERRKRLWLDSVYADLGTQAALEMAVQCQVSLRFAAQVAGLIVNLDSFLDIGYVYGSQAGLARYIKNENGQPVSVRHFRRGIKFMRERGHLRIEQSRGIRNRMFPLYRAVESEDIVSAGQGHEVPALRTSCPTESVTKQVPQTNTPYIPQLDGSNNVVKLADKAFAQNPGPNGQAIKRSRSIEGQEVVHHRLARRLGEGNVERGYLVLFDLPDGLRDELTAMERVGKLTDPELARIREGGWR